jgi:hypothetical protein
MPALDATTTAAFSAAGISPTTLYTWVQYMFSYSISVGIWIFEAMLPFLLILAFIGILTGIVFAIVRWGRHR